jgi:plastocyanin
MKRSRIGLLALLASVTLVAAACGGGGGGGGGATPKASGGSEASGEEAGGTITLGGQSATNKGTKSVSGKDEFDVEADNEGSTYYFEPTVLTGTAGQKIELEIENAGSVPHNFSLTEQSISQDVQPGSKVKVDVTFPQSGQLVFFCRFHRGLGMLGALQVGS